jgi:G3E family GTPase
MTEGYETFVLKFDKIFERKKFERAVKKLPKEIERAKGFVKFQDGLYLFQYSFGNFDFEKWKDQEEAELVFIGRGILNLKEKICKIFLM